MAKKIIVGVQKNRFEFCEALENGDILFFPKIPFTFPQEEIDFLLTQKQGSSKTRKNIAYKPQIDKITNHDSKDPVSAEKLKTILKNYSERVTCYLTTLLAPYSQHWIHDYASFRPFQEMGRKLRQRARNDLLHVDAFPTRPLHGARILRFFTNINPKESRRWITSDGFADLAAKYGNEVPFPKKTTGMNWLRHFGLPLRSPYDHFMLNMHHFLKENQAFQENCHKDEWDFPPNSCWAVFTDQVSHAALAGQYALEQTFVIPRKALLCPEKAPISVLERLFQRNFIDAERAALSFKR